MHDNKNRIQYRAFGPLLERLQERSRAAGAPELSDVAHRDAERYYALLAETLKTVTLTEAEAMLLCDALNGVLAAEPPAVARLLWAQVEDAVRLDGLAEKWGVNGIALVGELKSYSFAQCLAVIDAAERWWKLPDQSDRAATLKAVGLVR